MGFTDWPASPVNRAELNAIPPSFHSQPRDAGTLIIRDRQSAEDGEAV